jgi:hypothetical protein
MFVLELTGCFLQSLQASLGNLNLYTLKILETLDVNLRR